MIQLASNKISTTTQKFLNSLQAKIDFEPTFTQKVATAKKLWNSKGGVLGKKAFDDVYKKLYEQCVYTGICNYCEQNEANDIEHIYPKSFFPESTFSWSNYLLACKQCNTAYKLDKCFVLDTMNNVVNVMRGNEPKHKTIAFINPKIEDPNKFMMLNLLSWKFDLLPGLTKKLVNKANSTLQILELNDRDVLIESRKSAARHYYEMLNRLILILNSNSIAELEHNLTPYESRFDFTQPLGSIKTSIITSYKQYISTYQHPSVWFSIKHVESKTNPKWQALFNLLPVALTW